uniref:Reverse transcriptase domain-containing protein n=1 Tax=Anolis carolinensis TaxID=28377 RepID=A0A803TLV0_ANOCA
MEGRYIAVLIDMDRQKTLICNIYAPNGPKKHFVNELKKNIMKVNFDHLIILGDFNGVLDARLDTSNSTKNRNYVKSRLIPQNFVKLKEELDLQDAWRIHNPGVQDYTFFSARHKSWARIDMVWVSNSFCTKIKEVKIHPRDKSDHCPITITVNRKLLTYRWRLDENLLKLEEDIKINKQLIKEYFTINNTPEIKVQTLWDAFKAVTRGYFIQQKVEKNKRKNKELNKIKKEIESLESNLKINPSNKEIIKELSLWKKKKTQRELEETARQLKFIKQYNFENANKPGQWLARRIRKKKQRQQITNIIENGQIYTTDEEILEIFKQYYTNLYRKEEVNLNEISQYLGEFKFQKISDQQREILNKEITITEIRKAIMTMKPNKAPGPDGFQADFYKVFQEETLPHLQNIMNAVLKNSEIPESWLQAEIVAIPKENSDLTNIRNYRPISLLNTDYKIFTTILANRFKEFLKEWISPDQKGFLPGRNMSENVRCIVDIIEYYEHHHEKEIALLAIDAEKAFDNLNWSFFKLLFKELDIGFYFLNAIEAIYSRQTAKVTINNQQSREFKIEKGTRQGCPLSPLIFIFALELLINSIRKDKELKGTKIRNQEYKIRAFADDVICIIEEPRQQISKWMATIERFGNLAGFKLNKQKTKMLTKNITKKNQVTLQEISGLKITPKLKYLGIWLTAKNNQLLKNNYQDKWKEIQKDLRLWQSLNISLLGRIATIKMNILPKMLHLFQNLPILRNQNQFKIWNKEISKFIWKNKKPRVNYKVMTDLKSKGGFGLPNLHLYYEACALKWVKEWITLADESILTLEGFDLRRGWHAHVWYGKRAVEKNFGNHFIRASLIKIWEKYKNFLYQKTPLWTSSLEANQRNILGWKNWPRYKDLLKKKEGEYELKPQEELKDKFKSISWFQYVQIKEQFIKDKIIGFSGEESTWDKILSANRKEISRIYNMLLGWSTETESVKNCMIRWAKNIGRPIRMEEWEQIWNKKLKYTYAWDLKENWLKIFHRWYMTPKKLNAMYKNYQNKCWKCKKQEGTFFHVWWTCEKLQNFWKMIHVESQKILNVKFPMKPEYYLLGLSDTSLKLDTNDDKLFTYICTAARIIIAKRWKTEEIPQLENWLEKVEEIKDMDKLTFYLKTSRGKLIKSTNWEKFDKYINENLKQ